MKKSIATNTLLIALASTFIVGELIMKPVRSVKATSDPTEIYGKHYEFAEDDDFSLSGQNGTLGDSMLGKLEISGNDYTVYEENGFTRIAVNKDYVNEDIDYNLNFTYSYSSAALLSESDDQWHVFDSDNDEIDYIKLDDDIEKGAIVLQVSKDKLNWYTEYERHNILEEASNGLQNFYQTRSIHLVNGCYYRVIVVYETECDDFDDKKHLEIFEFYAYDAVAAEAKAPQSNTKNRLGEKVKCDKSNGYYGIDSIDRDDPHYGWDLGQFFVGGYTDTITMQDGTVVFLKNTGDQISLWFDLLQNINAINSDDDVFVKSDSSGYDQEFETQTINFGRGALIIQKTNYENTKEDPVIYTNFLEANASPGANTIIDLFEEGDYEVALDYRIQYGKKKTRVLKIEYGNKTSYYRIAFKFSVRNADAMIFPRDCKTQSDLSNEAIAPNGFYIDLAGSRYLKAYVKREILIDGTTGLTEDTRFNRATRNGEEFKDEGIYTIIVTNQYTDRSTTKKIYVGENKILKAYMVTGLPISEIKKKIDAGATIDDDGNIIEPIPVTSETTTVIPSVDTTSVSESSVAPSDTTESSPVTTTEGSSIATGAETEEKNSSFSLLIVILAISGAVAVCIAGVIFFVRAYRPNLKRPANEIIPRLPAKPGVGEDSNSPMDTQTSNMTNQEQNSSREDRLLSETTDSSESVEDEKEDEDK